MKKLVLFFIGLTVFMKLKRNDFKVSTPTTVFYKEKMARKLESLKIFAQMQLEKIIGYN